MEKVGSFLPLCYSFSLLCRITFFPFFFSSTANADESFFYGSTAGITSCFVFQTRLIMFSSLHTTLRAAAFLSVDDKLDSGPGFRFPLFTFFPSFLFLFIFFSGSPHPALVFSSRTQGRRPFLSINAPPAPHCFFFFCFTPPQTFRPSVAVCLEELSSQVDDDIVCLSAAVWTSPPLTQYLSFPFPSLVPTIQSDMLAFSPPGRTDPPTW